MPDNNTINSASHNLLTYLILVLIPIGIYYQCTNYGYVLDDKIVITDNDFTKQGISGIDDLLMTESMTGYFGEQKNLVQGNRYRPLSLITFAIEYQLAGSTLSPALSHWVNIILYGLSGIMLFIFLRRIYPSESDNWLGIALLTSVFFLVHPIHVEAIANIKGRDEILAMLLSVLSAHLLLKSDENHKWLYLGLGSFTFFLALLAKENSVTWLAVIPTIYLLFRDSSYRQAFTKAIPYAIVFALYMILRISAAGIPDFGAESTDVMNNPFLGMSSIEKLSTIGYTLIWYLKLLAIPYPMSHDYYPYSFSIMDLTNWQTWLSILTYGALIIWAIKGFLSKDKKAFPVLYYLITLTIVSNIVVNLGTFMNDRFVYMPSLGFCLGVVYLARKVLGKKIGTSVLLVIAATFAFLSFIRVPAWESAVSLNRSAVQVSPNSARANSFMATAYFEEYKVAAGAAEKKRLLDLASPFAEKAVSIIPDYYNGNLMLSGIAAEHYKLDQNIDDLLRRFEVVGSARPEVPFLTEYCTYLNSRADSNKLVNFYYRLATNLAVKRTEKNYRWALHYLKFAIELAPTNKAINQLSGECYQAIGNTNAANQFFSRANQSQ